MQNIDIQYFGDGANLQKPLFIYLRFRGMGQITGYRSPESISINRE